MIRGGCFCGFVRYEANGPVSNETSCHCSICRRTSGAPSVAWITVPAAGFRVLDGKPHDFPSSDHGQRTFCPRCGTPLTFRSTRFPDEIDITTCSLETPADWPPRDHTWTSAALSWNKRCDGLPEFAEARLPEAQL
jgi:hypothetical protein